jgi:hypothetical protein
VNPRCEAGSSDARAGSSVNHAPKTKPEDAAEDGVIESYTLSERGWIEPRANTGSSVA